MRSLDKDLNRHKISWWEKFTLSLGCLVFFFIGAPLGAIVRKGGLGYPVLISVATFILYYIFTTSGAKLAREGEWHTWFGAWLSTMVLAPLGIFFTYQANKDSGIFNGDSIKSFFTPGEAGIAPMCRILSGGSKRMGCINRKGEIVIPFEYDFISMPVDGVMTAKLGVMTMKLKEDGTML